MRAIRHCVLAISLSVLIFPGWNTIQAQMPVKYATLELFTNTPCPICGSSNPGFFDRLENYEGQYHLISFWPGKPYSSCVFYQANISENTARFNYYPMVFGTPTVAINGTEFRSSGSVSNAVLDGVTGGESWLSIGVEETTGTTRIANITLTDHVGGSISLGKLFAVIVEKEVMYNAPNGETLHHNVFRKFLSSTDGDDIDLSSGVATKSYQYNVEGAWQADQIYVIAWLTNTGSKEVINSGTKFDPILSSTAIIERQTLNIFPNPATSEVQISIPENALGGIMKVYDIQGRLVYSNDQVSSELATIPTTTWYSGNYTVRIRVEKRIFQGRFEVVR